MRGVLRAYCEDQTWTFVVEQGPGDALARVGPWRITHRERSRPWLADLSRRLRDAPGDDVETELRAALSDVGARVESFRWIEDIQWPRWPEQIRIGFPAPGHLWPCDVELAGLRAGTRTVIKREGLHGPGVNARIASWNTEGLAFAQHEGIAFAALEASTVDAAVQWEMRISTDEEEASRRLGEMLGYPSCCIDAYLRLDAHDDRALAEAHLGQQGPPEAGFLIAPLALLSHVPCSATCEESVELGRTLLRTIDACCPGFEAQWRQAATGVWGIDAAGVAWVLGPSTLRLEVRDDQIVLEQAPQVPDFVASMDHSLSSTLPSAAR